MSDLIWGPDGKSISIDPIEGPAREAFLIVPHDTDEIAPTPKGVVIGSDGDIVFRAVDSSVDVTFPVLKGQILPIRMKYIRATNTTVTHILAVA